MYSEWVDRAGLDLETTIFMKTHFFKVPERNWNVFQLKYLRGNKGDYKTNKQTKKNHVFLYPLKPKMSAVKQES